MREMIFVMRGSSPRVRGKDGGLAIPGGDDGIIPAGAGKRALKAALEKASRDHPRGCGEKNV